MLKESRINEFCEVTKIRSMPQVILKDNSSISLLKKEKEIGFAIFEKIFNLKKEVLFSLLRDLFKHNKNILDIIDSNPRLIKKTVDDKPEEIQMFFYDGIIINYAGIIFDPENGPSKRILNFDKFFNLPNILNVPVFDTANISNIPILIQIDKCSEKDFWYNNRIGEKMFVIKKNDEEYSFITLSVSQNDRKYYELGFIIKIADTSIATSW